MIKNTCFLLFFICLVINSKAQKIYHLHGNAAIIQHNKKLNKKSNASINGRNPRNSTDSLLHGRYLPFYDDFSYAGPYPNDSLWLDQYVFVNHTKAIAPPTLGVATFDGLNQYGYPYDSTITSAGGGFAPPHPSDTLTSHPIRLDSLAPHSGLALSPSDSVYLSFYYQSMGFWEEPATSGYGLFLDLYSPIDSAWYEVWSVSGYYPTDSLFHLVMIPITDQSYFGNGFQFRFRNLSCGCGDDDHWHIDAVYLNKRVDYKDTITKDVSFVYDLQSPLKNYTQMPYNQFTGISDMKAHISTFLRSNFYNAGNTPPYLLNISTYYNFLDASNHSLLPGDTAHLNGSNNLASYYNSGYCNDTVLAYPYLHGFSYPTPLAMGDSFTVQCYVSKLGAHTVPIDAFPQNDTATFHQVFSNYFSYDDGSAEGAFGPTPGVPPNFKTVARYVLNKQDTLRAIDIFFDPIIDIGLLENSPFNLIVLGDNSGSPGGSIYEDTTGGTVRYPFFAANHPISGVQRENLFIRYQLLRPVIINAGQPFYVGINQLYSTPAIPIGFDMNTDYHNNMFYNANNPNFPGWYVFPGDADPVYRGALMIHPVFGDSLLALSIPKYKNTVSANINVYPNPATDQVFIQSENIIAKIVVTDLIGNLIIQQSSTDNNIQNISTASLQSGAYLIKAYTDKGLTDTKKLIISR